MTLLKELLREEWRLHSNIFGNTSFALFTLIIFGLCLLFSTVTPLLIPLRSVYAFTHYLFLALGIMIGGFGLSSREVLNRRFGEVSFLAYSSRILPISIKKIFLNFAAKDVIYYSFFFIIPFCTAFTASSLVTPVTVKEALTLFITLPLSFLLGLSLSFFASTLYNKFRTITQITLAAGLVYLFLNLGTFTQESVYESLNPALQTFLNPSITNVIMTKTTILFLFSASILLFKFDFKSRGKSYKTRFRTSSEPSQMKAFMLKDLLDLNRSQGGFGKIIFSFLIPLFIVEVMISFVLRIFSISSEGMLLLFSVVIGVTASTVYNWLTEFDDSEKYLNLPVSMRKACLSKTILTIIIGGLSGTGMLLASFLFSEAGLPSLWVSFTVFVSVLMITISVLVYLAGLKPNLLLFEAKTFAKYILSLSPVIIIFMLFGFSYTDTPVIPLSALITLLLSAIILKKGINRIPVT